MSKLLKRKSKLILTEEVKQKLDAMEDITARQVFEPKKSVDDEFFNLILDATEPEQGKRKVVKNKDCVTYTRTKKEQFVSVLLVSVLLLMFALFVCVLWNILTHA